MWGWGQKFQLSNHRIGSAGNQPPFFIGFQKALFNIIKDTLLALWRKESKSEVAQSCPTLWDPMDCSLYQAPPSMGFSRWEYWSGLPFPPPGDLPSPGIQPTPPVSSALKADSLPLPHQGRPLKIWCNQISIGNLPWQIFWWLWFCCGKVGCTRAEKKKSKQVELSCLAKFGIWEGK